jgi:Protein of unknown function (DUF2934)
MTKSGASKSVTLKRTTIAASKGIAAERASKLSAADGAALDVDATVGERVDSKADVEMGNRAHAMWAAQGSPDGPELAHWLRARSEHPKNS